VTSRSSDGRKLQEIPFSYQATKDGRGRINWGVRHVVTLKGAKAASFLDDARGLIGDELQLLLARVTGNFKRGNERPGSRY
jgi:hypothetical protein